MFNWFKKKPPVAKKDPATLPEFQAYMLTEILNTDKHVILKDASITWDADTVFIPERGIEIACNILEKREHANNVVVFRMAFKIKLNGIETFYEEMVAFGDKAEQAILDGLRAFKDGFLTGCFNCLAGYYEPRYEINGPAGKFHVTYSMLQVQGAFANDHHISETTFIDILFPLIKESYTQSGKEFRDYSYIKIYLSRMPEQTFTGECLYLNYQWEDGLNALIEQDYNKWKTTDKFLAKKQFIFIRKCA